MLKHCFSKDHTLNGGTSFLHLTVKYDSYSKDVLEKETVFHQINAVLMNYYFYENHI